MINIKNVTVLGSGVLGSQIAYQTAYSGFHVSVYDINDEVIEKAKKRFADLAETYKKEVKGAKDGKADEALSKLQYFTDMGAAVADADLAIEAVPETLELKRNVYTQLGKVAPEKTIFTTNSSTLLPSELKDYTGRPKKFLAMHFANQVWKFNTAEIMKTNDTDPSVFDTIVAFAEEIGMVPIKIRKEKSGYLLNSVLVPFLNSAMELVADGYADPADVDKVWHIATGSKLGPFEILDMIGMVTPYNILKNADDKLSQRLAVWLKANYIDKGKLGLSNGEGFYSHKK